MKMRRLGRTGLKVSEICLGTMTFGHQCDQRESFRIMDKAAEHGVNFIDAADVYPVPPSPETGAAPRKSSACGSKANAISSSWRPSAACASATVPTMKACRAATS